jgi:uncharacterized protein (TIGR02246 family)
VTNPGFPTQANDRDAIAAIVNNQAAAWNRADAPSFAERYREDGSFTNIAGTRAYGKAGFVDIHTTIFRTIFAGSQIRFHIDRILFLRPDVAIADIDATLNDVQQLPPGARLGSDGAMHSRLQEVLTKDDGLWSIAAFHNVAVAATSGP